MVAQERFCSRIQVSFKDNAIIQVETGGAGQHDMRRFVAGERSIGFRQVQTAVCPALVRKDPQRSGQHHFISAPPVQQFLAHQRRGSGGMEHFDAGAFH